MLPQRKNSLRLKNHDYNRCGLYFITICIHEKKPYLSIVPVGATHESPAPLLTKAGTIVDNLITALPSRFNLRVDKYVIMPNHVHILFRISDPRLVRATRESPLQAVPSEIARAVGYMKMNSSKEIHRMGIEGKIWQRGFHDHVVRNQRDYENIWKYIHCNPAIWHKDKFFITK